MTEPETMVFATPIKASKEAVWAELTKTDSPQAAFWNTVLHTTGLEPGARYQMRSPSGKYVNTFGTIEQYEPPTLLVQTLRFARFEDPWCTVTYRIEDAPDGDGVVLHVRVEGLPPDTETATGLNGSGGFRWVIKTIGKIVENGRPPLSTRAMSLVAHVFEKRMEPEITLVEHWPMDRLE